VSALINPLTGFSAQRYGVALGPFTAQSDASLGGYTVVNRYRPGALAATGTNIRLTLAGLVAAGHSGTLSNVTISLASKAAGANPYDSATAPTAVTFTGAASVAASCGSLHVSDIIAFTVDGSRAILIACNVAASAHVSLMSRLSADYISYLRAATAEAAGTARSAGYTAAPGTSYALSKLEAFS
jgi:hypothetical protein